MRRALCCLAGILLSIAPGASAQTLALTGTAQLGCDEVEGEYVAFLSPGQGIVLLSTQPFPGGEQVGSIGASSLSASVPGLGSLELSSHGLLAGTAIWGMLDRSLEIGSQRGCFGFGPRRWSDIDDLKTYLHWFVRQVLAKIPHDRSMGGPAPSVWLADRRVTLELLTPDHRTLRLRGTEGTTLGYRPRDSEATFFFQLFVLGGATTSAAVRVSVKLGDFFASGTTEEVAFAIVGLDEATTLPTTPAIALRLDAIEDPVEHED